MSLCFTDTVCKLYLNCIYSFVLHIKIATILTKSVSVILLSGFRTTNSGSSPSCNSSLGIYYEKCNVDKRYYVIASLKLKIHIETYW